jgi:hypothetical protein
MTDSHALTTTSYVPHERVALKSHPHFSEKWLQQRISEDPSILGLGDLEVKDLERRQSGGGRLDVLLADTESNTRYEVEIQLGATDESHIIRTIEYWDLERRRYQQYDHVAVIVAEEITSRFFNVISLFNGFIPIIAIQIQAIKVGDAMTLVATTVLDRATMAIEEEDTPGEARDRPYWEAKGSKKTLALTDELLDVIREIEPSVSLKYNKNYIGLQKAGLAYNFVSFRPKKNHVVVEFKLPASHDLVEQVEAAGIEVMAYQARWGLFRISVGPQTIANNRALLHDLAKDALATYSGNA